jgi:hypothetical protein
VFGGDLLGPPLDRGAGDLARAAAVAADEVVVMTAGTAAVVGLAAVEAQHIDLAGVGERLERAVDVRRPETAPLARKSPSVGPRVGVDHPSAPGYSS